MATLAKQQRLRTLENDIRKKAKALTQNGVAIGMSLIEIRGDRLWEEEYGSWNQYLRDCANELIGTTSSHAHRMVQIAEVHRKLPEVGRPGTTDLKDRQLRELARLAPSEDENNPRAKKDYSGLHPTVIARVLKSAEKIEDNGELSTRSIRKAVDDELGIDRPEKAKETNKKREEDIDLPNYLLSKAGQIEAITENLAALPAKIWTQLEETAPGTAEQLAVACDELAELLRS